VVALPELGERSCCIPTAGFPLVEYEKTVRVFFRNASPSCASQRDTDDRKIECRIDDAKSR
jgi:hypothetical protein